MKWTYKWYLNKWLQNVFQQRGGCRTQGCVWVGKQPWAGCGWGRHSGVEESEAFPACCIVREVGDKAEEDDRKRSLRVTRKGDSPEKIVQRQKPLQTSKMFEPVMLRVILPITSEFMWEKKQPVQTAVGRVLKRHCSSGHCYHRLSTEKDIVTIGYPQLLLWRFIHSLRPSIRSALSVSPYILYLTLL